MANLYHLGSTYVVYRDAFPNAGFDSNERLRFFPPEDSDELFDALRAKYPDAGSHSERMCEALLDFVTEEHQSIKRAAQVSPLPMYPDDSDQLSWPPFSASASTGSQTMQSSPPVLDESQAFKDIFGPLEDAFEDQQISLSIAEPPTPCNSIPPHQANKRKPRRKMSPAEKSEYRKRRELRACKQCAVRKRKCNHVKSGTERVVSGLSESTAQPIFAPYRIQASSSDGPIITGHSSAPTLYTGIENKHDARGSATYLQNEARTKQSQKDKFRFVVLDNPLKRLDKNEMKANRRHVMRNIFKKVVPQDRKATLLTSSSSENHSWADDISVGLLRHSTGMTLSYESNMEFLHAQPNELPSTSNSNFAKSGGGFDVDQCLAIQHPVLNNRENYSSCHTRLYTPANKCGVMGLYLTTPLELVPFQAGEPGRKLNPFGTWPAFVNARVDLEHLKYNCTVRFGCQAVADTWVPALLKARHAFYSTLCVSATHDDIMRRSLNHRTVTNRSYDSLQTIVVRDGVIRMINDSLMDPELQTSDGTIIAILHTLLGQLMDYERKSIKTHQAGLEAIIRMRSGMTSLGLQGQLATVLTLANTLIAINHEERPASIYDQWANRLQTDPKGCPRPFPESPIFCLPGFPSVARSSNFGNNLIRLLDLVHNSILAFKAPITSLQEIEPYATSHRSDPAPNLSQIRDRVFHFPPASSDEAATSNVRVYEAIRLTACLFVHALAESVPFSQAAFSLPLAMGRAIDRSVSIHVQIKRELQHTDLENCWGHLAGVLYWITLVACAAANPSQDPTELPSLTTQEMEIHEARRWLAAVSVRCSILLGFEHTFATLGTLKQMTKLQQRLVQQVAF